MVSSHLTNEHIYSCNTPPWSYTVHVCTVYSACYPGIDCKTIYNIFYRYHCSAHLHTCFKKGRTSTAQAAASNSSSSSSPPVDLTWTIQGTDGCRVIRFCHSIRFRFCSALLWFGLPMCLFLVEHLGIYLFSVEHASTSYMWCWCTCKNHNH